MADQGFDQEQQLDGVVVVEARVLSQGGVAGSVEHGFPGWDERSGIGSQVRSFCNSASWPVPAPLRHGDSGSDETDDRVQRGAGLKDGGYALLLQSLGVLVGDDAADY